MQLSPVIRQSVTHAEVLVKEVGGTWRAPYSYADFPVLFGEVAL